MTAGPRAKPADVCLRTEAFVPPLLSAAANASTERRKLKQIFGIVHTANPQTGTAPYQLPVVDCIFIFCFKEKEKKG